MLQPVNDLKNIKKNNRLDILVNNAGTIDQNISLKLKEKIWNILTNLNMKAAFNVAQLCSQKMVKFKNRKKIGGSIIHMSSQLGRVGCEGRNVYNMNKFGVEGLARGMAVELANIILELIQFVLHLLKHQWLKNFLKIKNLKIKC